MRVSFLAGAAVLCLTGAEAAQEPSTEESVKEAVLEAYHLAVVFEPDIELPTAELAGLMAILFGPQSLEHIDPLASNAVRWHRFGEALRILKISTLADVEQALRGTSEDTGFLYSPGSYNRRKPLSTGAPARLEELNSWVSRTSDLKPHIHTLLNAIRSQDLELAQAVAGMASARFAEVQTDATIALEMAFILQLRDWIGEEHYRAGIKLLIDTLGSVRWEDTYFLTTVSGNVELSPAEYFSFELVRRETITGQRAGLEMLAELPARVDQVGGWEEVHRWYRRDRLEPGGEDSPPEAVAPLTNKQDRRGRDLLARLASRDVVSAIQAARTEEDPETRLQYLIWAVQDWVVNWRRPGRASSG